MSLLFSPVTISGLELKNRIVMSPMCQYQAKADGFVTDWHRVHYPTRAVGGVGLIMVEATAVQPNGRISNQDLGIWSDDHIQGLSELVRLVHHHGAKIGIQLAHAGRKAQADGRHVAPSAIAFSDDYDVPEELAADEINEIVQAFRQAAIRAEKAGFDVVEIHAAHGYLINEFLSPLANHRQDEYGGNRENRFRLLEKTVKAVQEVWSGALFVRISAEEYAEGGNHIEDYVYYAGLLRDLGVHCIDVSSGGVVMAKIQDVPLYQVPFAERIKREAGILTGAVGKITTADQAEEILRQERADLIFIGRELLRNPYWAIHAARQFQIEGAVPASYIRGF